MRGRGEVEEEGEGEGGGKHFTLYLNIDSIIVDWLFGIGCCQGRLGGSEVLWLVTGEQHIWQGMAHTSYIGTVWPTPHI